jgi:hypothetical protein
MNEKEWKEEYYGSLVGCEIIEFKWDDEEEPDIGPFPTFVVSNKNNELFEIEISKDEEGNGPGFIFGLTFPETNE